VDVVAVDTATWTVAARAALERSPHWQTAFYTVLADSSGPVVAAQGVLTNGDGTYATLLRLVGDTVVSLGDPLEDCELLGVRPAGGELLALDIGYRDLDRFDLASQRVTATLSWSELTGPEPEAPDGGDVREGYWHAGNMFYLTDEHVLTATN